MTQRTRSSETAAAKEGKGSEAKSKPIKAAVKEAAGEDAQGGSSWVLAPAAKPPTREELMSRYRRERALPQDPFDVGERPTSKPAYRELIMANPQPAVRFAERLQAVATNDKAKDTRRGMSLGQTFAVAAAMALAAGAGAGMVNARFFSPAPPPSDVTASRPVMAEAGVASLPSAKQMAGSPALTTVITKKSVPIATLVVADAAGQTNSYIPLSLHAEPAAANSDIMLKISGIPDGAYLTSGHRQEDRIWALSLDDLKDVKLVVPKAGEPRLDLAVAAFEPKTGELAAPVKTMTVALSDVTIQPVSAPPPDQSTSGTAGTSNVKSPLPGAMSAPEPIPPPQSISVALQAPEQPEVQKLILDGDEFLRNGDLKAARSAYEKAWSRGAAGAAYGMARSYDAVALSSLDIKKAKPDKAKALSWYQRAASAGNEDAAAAIVRLNMKP